MVLFYRTPAKAEKFTKLPTNVIMYRAFSFNGNIYIIRLCHLPTLSETIKLENHKGEEYTPPNNNVKEFLRQVIAELHLNINLAKQNGELKTTTELGKEIIREL